MAGSLVAMAILIPVGFFRAGVALGLGLLIGSANGLWVSRTLSADAPFGLLSLGRMVALSAGAVAVGLALGADVAWLALVGLAVAQLTLAGAAFKEMLSG